MAAKPKETPSRISAFFSEIKNNLSEGALALSKMSSELIEEAKEKAEELYEAGSEKFEQASGVVQSYVDRYRTDQEIRSLNKERDELYARLGDLVFHEFKKNGTVSKQFMTTKKMSVLISSIETIDKKILKKGKELDKSHKK